MNTTRVALVTGGNRGIGLAVVRQLASLGLTVILTSRDQTQGAEVVQQLATEGLEVTCLPLDVTQPEHIKTLIATVEQTYGRLDVLVNNAGILLDRTASILETALAPIQTTFQTNLYGPLLLSQAVMPLMQRQGYGRIVNVSSGAGQLDDMGSGYPGYRLSKTALNALTRMLNAEVGPEILVNSMCPGWVRTDMGGSEAPRTPAEGADTIVWLATLPADGPRGGFFRNRQPIPW